MGHALRHGRGAQPRVARFTRGEHMSLKRTLIALASLVVLSSFTARADAPAPETCDPSAKVGDTCYETGKCSSNTAGCRLDGGDVGRCLICDHGSGCATGGAWWLAALPLG